MRKNILTILFFSSLVNYVTAQSWSPVGTGIGSASYHSVRSFATYNGELYAGGYFTTAGGMPVNNIAKWNGTNWSNVGGGISGDVLSLCAFNGELYAGGYLSGGIAKWNGTNWSNVGNVEASVKAMAVYNGELYAAGWFSNLNSTESSIAKWNGVTWSPVGNGIETVINSAECLAVYNGELYVAGAYIGGGGVAVNYSILRWNGFNWTNLSTLPASYTLDGALGDILSMTVFNGELYVAGTFGMMIDSVSTSQIAKWNGTNWSAVGTGINPEAYPFGGDSDGSAYSFVSSLTVYNGALYAGGRFTYCGIIATRNIAKWNGTSWSALEQGINGHVYELIAFDTSLYVGGKFNAVNGNSIPANKIARWNEICTLTPSQPAIISGNDSICHNSQQTYFVNEIPGAASYTWTFPPGWTGSSNTNTIIVTAGTTGGIISVTANNACGTSIAQSFDVIVLANSVPFIQSTITGSNLVCYGAAQTYFINVITDATGYTWNLPWGWTGNSTDTAITVIAGGTAGVISVTANNTCGNSLPQSITVTPNFVPQLPQEINGNLIGCKGIIQIYSIQPVPQATDYTWILPSGWAGNSISPSITATAGNYSGNILVAANNSCGSSSYQTLPVLIDSIPSKPGDIAGNVYVFAGQSHSYYVNKINNISLYNWSLSGGGNIISGQNTSKVDVNWQTPGTYILSANTTNSCGVSADQTITIKVSAANIEDPYNLQLYPNPSSGQFFLKAKRVQDRVINVEVLNMAGQFVFRSGKKQGANDYTQPINLDKMAMGIYAVKIMIDDKTYVRSVMIKH